MKTGFTYSDRLISIKDDTIIFNDYYFPTMKEKTVRLADIEKIVVRPLTIWNGKWRLHGTGNFKIWYPRDNDRPKRDRVFFAKLKNQWINIGFTVERADEVEKIFAGKNLLKAA
jgi:hypothetical protein